MPILTFYNLAKSVPITIKTLVYDNYWHYEMESGE